MGAPAVKKRGTEEAPKDAGKGKASQLERGSDRLIAILLSVLVHGLIVGALFWGWWRYRTPPPATSALAIQAAVVRASPDNHVETPSSIHPPTDQTRMDEQREAAQAKAAADAAALAAQKAAAEKAAADKAAADKAAADKAAQAAAQQAAQQVAAIKAAAAQAAAAQAAADKAAADKAEQEQREAAAAAAKAAAEKEARAQAKLAAERKAKQEAEQKAQAEQLRAQQAEEAREADLKNQLQSEEKLDALQNGPAEEEYRNAISAKITRAWIRPASAQPGVTCTIHLKQIAGGDVTNVVVEGCNGDEAVRQSVQTAAYRSSPLPAPPDPALFDPNITVTFAPDQ